MTLAELEKRVRAIEEAEQIKKMHQQYMTCLDNLQFEKAADYYTDDATAEVRNSGVKRGKKEIKKFYLENLGQRKTRNDGHLIAQPDLTVNGDTAHGEWIIYMFFSKPAIQWVQGRHDCEYRKENGQWKFSRLKFSRTLASQPDLWP